jgi:tetratricopeptide (TPR) repeat protein
MKVLKITLIFLVFSLVLSEFCIAQNAGEHFQRGLGYLETGLIDKAIAEFKKALPLFGEGQSQEKAEVYVALANAYNWKGIHKAAITACKKAIEINPDLTYAHYNLGFAYREEGKDRLSAKEFALYNKLLKQQGEYVEIPEKSTSDDINKYVTNGDNYFKEGKLDEAISEYKKAFEIEPRDEILNKLSQVYQKKRLAGKSEDESAITEQLTTLENIKEEEINPPLAKGEARLPSPSDRQASVGQGGGFVGFSEEVRGPGESDKMVEETTVDGHSIRGSEYYNKGMLDEAIEEFKEVLEIDPDDAEAHYNLGNAYVDKEMFEEAISAYKKAIELNPEFIDAYLNLGMVYLNKDLTDDAISLYKQALKLNPNDPFLYYHLGEAYAYKERYDKAVVELKKAVSINPMDPETQYRLAEMYYETEQFDLALEHIRRAEELGHPLDQEFIDNLKKKAR